jgi:small-conductance mechanosensitive channel
MRNFRRMFLFVPMWILLFVIRGYAQPDTTVRTNDVKDDSASLISKLDKVRQIGENAIQQIVAENKEKQIHSRQMVLLDELDGELNKVNERFRRGIDTAFINQEIKQIEEQFRIASEGTNANDVEIPTIRNLNTSAILLKEIIIRLDNNKQRVKSLLGELNPLRNRIDSLQSDTILFKFSKDTVLFKEYYLKLSTLLAKIVPTDSSLTTAIKNLRESENYMANLGGNINTSINLIEESKSSLSHNLFSKDLNFLHDSVQSKDSFEDKVRFSYTKAILVLDFYLVNNSGKVLLIFFAFIIQLFFLHKVRKRYGKNDSSVTTELTDLVFEHPILSSAYISLTIVQFLFVQPPVIFSGLLWTLSSIILTAILWKQLSGSQRAYWMYFISAFMATLLVELLLKEAQIERWVMLIIAISGILFALTLYRKNVFPVSKNKIKITILVLTLLLLSGSVIANLAGRYNLSKIYLAIYFFAALTAFLLYWAMILSIELLNASVDSYKSEGNQNFQNRVQKLRIRIPLYLKYVLFAGWIILVARNLYFYDRLSSNFISFMEEETTIGDFSFSFEKLLLFVFIILLSTVISKAISFYADKNDNSGRASDKEASIASGLSNWMLLIRIGVISIGVILAFAATGLPIDKLTLIIGSLGVGIGLGLQSVVSNLVSGIILAFEKPFTIGDYIEVSDEEGRIKEIGIRSSKLSTADGADIIIPNGELLSKHVINWTLRDSRKRSELVLSINYDNKLIEVRDILQRIMDSKEQIEKNPPPVVMMNQFSIGTAEYRMLYWTSIDIEEEVKSDLIIDVEAELKKAGIELSA